MFKKTQNLKDLTVNRVPGLLRQCSRVQIFLLVFFLFVERDIMDSSHMFWNKFQDYQDRYILKDRFLVTA